jgi:hypothetical protein
MLRMKPPVAWWISVLVFSLTTPLFADAFYTVPPCRALDTRSINDPVQTNTPTLFAVGGTCDIPPDASSVSLNATLIGVNADVSLGVFPGNGVTLPMTNVVSEQVAVRPAIAGAAVVALSTDGLGTVEVLANSATGGEVHLLLDVNGFFYPQTLEFAGGNDTGNDRVISPTFYSSDPLSGGYSAPKGIQLNNTLFLFVQGGQFSAATSPPQVPFCVGDMIVEYTAPATAAGVQAPFTPVARFSNCDSSGSINAQWSPGNIFPSGSTYYMVAREIFTNTATGTSTNQYNVWMGTFNAATNQLVGSWYPFLLLKGQGIEAPVLQPDATRTAPGDGFTHAFFRGFARLDPSGAAPLRIDFSNAYCAESLSAQVCAQIELMQGGAWVDTAGSLTFTPDAVPALASFKPTALVAKSVSPLGAVAGPLELWGAYDQMPSNALGPCPGPTGGGFSFYKVNADWSVGAPYVIRSLLRNMPQGRAVLRSDVAPVYLGANLFLLTGANEANVCNDINSGQNPQVGEYMIWTQLESPPNPQ